MDWILLVIIIHQGMLSNINGKAVGIASTSQQVAVKDEATCKAEGEKAKASLANQYNTTPASRYEKEIITQHVLYHCIKVR
jgi:hypothetical protein